MNKQEVLTEIRMIANRRGSLKADEWRCRLSKVPRCDRSDCCEVCQDWYRYWKLIDEVEKLARKEANTVPLSKAFVLAFASEFSTESLKCGFCNRVCSPERDEKHIRFGMLDGKIFIPNCNCEQPRHYEELFRDNREQIMNFFKLD